MNCTKKESSTVIHRVLSLVAILVMSMTCCCILRDLLDGMMEKMDQTTGQLTPLGIMENDCISFGFANMIISMIAFLIISYLIKWGSTNVPRAPF